MSCDKDPIEVYFCPPPKINVNKNPGTNETGKEPGPNDFGVIEYYMEESPSSFRRGSSTDEYVLSNPVEIKCKNDTQVGAQQPRQKKPVIQDEYDENHYCLARPSDDGTDTIRITRGDNEKNNTTNLGWNENCFVMKNKKIIWFLCILVVVFAAGGVIAYLTLGKKGNTIIVEF